MTYSQISQPPPSVPPPVVDFGWYYGTTPTRLPEYSYIVSTTPPVSYPPGHTVLTSSTTVGTSSFTLPVASTAAFEATGVITLNDGTTHTNVSYAGKTSNTFTGCIATISHTFNTGTPIYDPRFYVDDMPLLQTIMFDALDAHNLGLPITTAAASAPIISYQWNLGNGTTGYGSSTSIEYTYSMPVPSIQATLTVRDSLNRQFSVAHKLNLQSLHVPFGYDIKVSQGSGRT
jgi:hypothetical protein